MVGIENGEILLSTNSASSTYEAGCIGEHIRLRRAMKPYAFLAEVL
ncbi:hypothetical protein [Bacteroides sp. An322]|nr:hypothetical protein [Bacteroides sp. An322]